jgi:hypothetical protein
MESIGPRELGADLRGGIVSPGFRRGHALMGGWQTPRTISQLEAEGYP